MSDYEHRQLEASIRDLERKVDDLAYDLRKAQEDLESDIRGKADRHHTHEE